MLVELWKPTPAQQFYLARWEALVAAAMLLLISVRQRGAKLGTAQLSRDGGFREYLSNVVSRTQQSFHLPTHNVLRDACRPHVSLQTDEDRQHSQGSGTSSAPEVPASGHDAPDGISSDASSHDSYPAHRFSTSHGCICKPQMSPLYLWSSIPAGDKDNG